MGTAEMFYSKALLSKKGAFGAVWFAAFCRESALTRDQVARTDIVATVDKILSDVQGPQKISLRILAQLLFGIARIYSKKVYYLYRDCEEVRSLHLKQCVEPSAPTGGLTRGVLKQVNRAVRGERSVAGHQNKSKAKKPVHAVRTEVSSPISSEGFSVTVETEVIVRTSVVVREAHVANDLPTFTIPKRFELDSFDLGISEDTDDEVEDHHQSARQDILLEDERHHTPYMYESYQRVSCSYDVDSTCFMPEYIAVPCDVMCAISEANDSLTLMPKGDKPEIEDQNADSAWFTPVKDVLPPDMMDMVAEPKDSSDKSKTGDNSTSKVNMDENSGGSTCPMTPFPPQESQGRQNSEGILENTTCGSLSANNPTMEAPESDSLLGISNTTPTAGFSEHGTGEHESQEWQNSGNSLENMTCESLSASNPTMEASESDLLLGKLNITPPAAGVPEPDTGLHESLETPVLSCETRAENELSPSTPEPLPQGVPGASSSSRFRVRTPAKTEKSQATRKRSRTLYNKEDYIRTEQDGRRRVRRRLTWSLCDEEIVLSNEMCREAIADPSNLIQKRRKAPHTHLDIWKVEKVGSLPYTFMDPLITYKISTPLARVTAPLAPGSSCEESVKTRRCLYEHTEPIHSCKDTEITERENILDAPRRKLDEATDFEAPIDCHTESGPVQDGEYNEDTDKEKGTQVKGDEPSSEIPPKKGLHEPENQIQLNHEAMNAALDNIDEDICIDEEHTRDEGLLNSTRTRKIATYLHQQFLDQKSKKGTNSLSLTQVLKGTNRRTAATFFYENLILQSRGIVKVNQEQPYADIILSATPQLEVEVQRGRN